MLSSYLTISNGIKLLVIFSLILATLICYMFACLVTKILWCNGLSSSTKSSKCSWFSSAISPLKKLIVSICRRRKKIRVRKRMRLTTRNTWLLSKSNTDLPKRSE